MPPQIDFLWYLQDFAYNMIVRLVQYFCVQRYVIGQFMDPKSAGHKIKDCNWLNSILDYRGFIHFLTGFSGLKSGSVIIIKLNVSGNQNYPQRLNLCKMKCLLWYQLLKQLD